MLVVQVKHVTEQKMIFSIKSIVISLIFISKVLLFRSFGKLIYDYAQKNEEHLGVRQGIIPNNLANSVTQNVSIVNDYVPGKGHF